ncbi:MAG TPA: RluA family pseudouridine synthase [Micavibrio sp.]
MTGQKNEVQQLTVADDDDGQRLDRWLKKVMPGVPYALLQKLMRTGQVRVNGKRAKAETRLESGQTVRIPPLDVKTGDKTGNHFTADEGDRKYLENMVIYDDGDLLALNKPYGIAVQGGSGIRRHIDGLLDLMTSKKGVKPRLVHRLDRDTSGVLLVARSLKMAQAMGAMFSGRDIRKYYWALTVPVPEVADGTIRMALNKGEGRYKDMMVVDEVDGKKATTEFRILDRAGRKAAFVAFWPRTGRTHQIRVHAASGLGCPIYGDEKYGGDVPDLDDLQLSGRLHLHARRVIFPHPLTGKMIDIIAPLPDDMRKSFQTFNFDYNSKEDPFADIEL